MAGVIGHRGSMTQFHFRGTDCSGFLWGRAVWDGHIMSGSMWIHTGDKVSLGGVENWGHISRLNNICQGTAYGAGENAQD